MQFHIMLHCCLFFKEVSFAHLSGDLRIALAAEVGGIVNLLWMPRTLCESDHDNDVDNDYGTESDESEKTIKMIRMVKLPQ